MRRRLYVLHRAATRLAGRGSPTWPSTPRTRPSTARPTTSTRRCSRPAIPARARPRRASSALVSSVDLFATVLELLGVTPGDWASATDAVSLVPYLASPDQPALRDWAFSEQFGDSNDPTVDGKAIRDARYKLIRFDDGRESLYDLVADPYEAVDLLQGAPSDETTAARTALVDRLDRLLAGPPATPGPSATATITATFEAPNETPAATAEPPEGSAVRLFLPWSFATR